MGVEVDEHGYFGEFGGAYVPEMLQPNIDELRDAYYRLRGEASFQAELARLLRDFVGRPSPLYFASRLSERHGMRIFLKREDLNHTGAHKINNTVGQALLAKRLGKTRVIAETGAGQHGVATATVCALMGLRCVVYMGEVDMERQAPNVARMRLLGAEVRGVSSGSRTLKDATNEALRDWIGNPSDTHYIIGSVVGPHPFPSMVAELQAVIGREIRQQLEREIGSGLPACVLACVGGGSNAIGAFHDFLSEPKVRLVAVEAAGKGIDSGESAATMALGRVGVLHGCKTLVMQSEDGQIEEAHSISAGLDYPGIGPQHAALRAAGRVSYVSIRDDEALAAGMELSRIEGIIPALESAHALAYLPKLGTGRDEAVVVCLSGRGDKDLKAYGAALGGLNS